MIELDIEHWHDFFFLFFLFSIGSCVSFLPLFPFFRFFKKNRFRWKKKCVFNNSMWGNTQIMDIDWTTATGVTCQRSTWKKKSVAYISVFVSSLFLFLFFYLACAAFDISSSDRVHEQQNTWHNSYHIDVGWIVQMCVCVCMYVVTDRCVYVNSQHFHSKCVVCMHLVPVPLRYYLSISLYSLLYLQFAVYHCKHIHHTFVSFSPFANRKRANEFRQYFFSRQYASNQ